MLYPIYIISKGRWETRLTSKALEKMEVPYRIVIEPQEYEQYSNVISKEKILILPFSNLGLGGIPARNWVWEHSTKEGHKRHWILDDNIRWFGRINKNKKTLCSTGICFDITEEFVDRYENIKMAGLQYEMFMPASSKARPFILNTRCYSCILLSNDIEERWRGRYNEDTDLSIRILKKGYCTLLMQTFICKKTVTMTMKGGNTEELYKIKQDGKDGRLLMAESLYKQHPGIVTIKTKWGRAQHVVDYTSFRKNRLIWNKEYKYKNGINEFGMKYIKKN